MATITTEQALQTALAFFRMGQATAAHRLCDQILSQHPGHPGAIALSKAISEKVAPAEIRAEPVKGAGASNAAPAPGQRHNLFYGGIPGNGFGWGVCNGYLIGELSKRVNLLRPLTEKHGALRFDGEVFMVLTDHDFSPQFPIRGVRNFGYTFFERALGPNAATNAAKYDVIFCGSTWCLQRLREHGIHHGKVLVQGVDHKIFHPEPAALPASGRGMRIFSGGKFEIRKGQDIIIAAFREILKKHPDAVLVCAWHHWWPKEIPLQTTSPHLTYPDGWYETPEQFYRALFAHNGIPERNYELHPLSSHAQIADVMRSTDFGVFPNRCEGGTNLMLMEYLACGRPVVATASTGHADVLSPDYALQLQPHIGASFWEEPDVAEVVEKMEQFLGNSDLRERMGAAGAAAMGRWTWERAANTIVETIYAGNFR